MPEVRITKEFSSENNPRGSWVPGQVVDLNAGQAAAVVKEGLGEFVKPETKIVEDKDTGAKVAPDPAVDGTENASTPGEDRGSDSPAEYLQGLTIYDQKTDPGDRERKGAQT